MLHVELPHAVILHAPLVLFIVRTIFWRPLLWRIILSISCCGAPFKHNKKDYLFLHLIPLVKTLLEKLYFVEAFIFILGRRAGRHQLKIFLIGRLELFLRSVVGGGPPVLKKSYYFKSGDWGDLQTTRMLFWASWRSKQLFSRYLISHL